MPEQDFKLFEKQKKVYPQRTWGRYRKLKWFAMIVLLGIYYAAPWIRWDRGPYVPDQAILIDMPARRAYFFFIEIWPQEVYYLTAILIFAALMLFMMTSLLGRVWCGYACPQTVWTDLFVWVERIVQGDRNARLKLDRKSFFSPIRLFKKAVTHLLWIAIGVCTGGAWVFYFNDAPTIWDQFMHWDLSWSVTSWIIALTGSTYLMAGFAREQVCTYMCPYARFQSAMFDDDTLIIGYDEKRGEPRGKHKKGETWEGRGDCISCQQCVNVCPTGIDIRDGLQMECIACGLCVDACNTIMDKVERPRGLIRYDTARHLENPSPENKVRIIRPRVAYYIALITLLGGLVLYGLLNRELLELHANHDRNPLFVLQSDGSIRNGYTIKIMNKTHEDQRYQLSLDGLEGAEIKVQSVQNFTIDELHVLANSVGQFRLFVYAQGIKARRQEITFTIRDIKTNETTSHDSVFITRNKE